MHRRFFLAALPLASKSIAAQTVPPMIGVLAVSDEFFHADLFRKAMHERGWAAGSYRMEFRSARGQVERLDELARELVAMKVNALVAVFTPAALAAKRATQTIPIVMTAGDPLGSGVVSSVARPEGNITGVDTAGGILAGKRVEVLREVLPTLRRIGVMINPADPFNRSLSRQATEAASTVGIQVEVFPAAADLEKAMSDMKAARIEGVIVQPSLPQRLLGQRLTAAGMPAVSGDRQFVTAGGLMSVSAPFSERYRLIAHSLDRVLKGTSPRDLPILQTSQFEIQINRSTARLLGLTLPPILLTRADEFID